MPAGAPAPGPENKLLFPGSLLENNLILYK
jgi:hypothetical protein